MFLVSLEVDVTYFLEYIRASRSRAMAEAVSRRPFPKQTVIRCRANSRETCGDQSGTETVVFSEYLLRLSTASSFPTVPHSYLPAIAPLTTRKSGPSVGTFDQSDAVLNLESNGQKSTFTLFIPEWVAEKNIRFSTQVTTCDLSSSELGTGGRSFCDFSVSHDTHASMFLAI